MNSPCTIRVVAAVIAQDGKYLITQRRPTATLPLLWEFPGGRVEDGETHTDAEQFAHVGFVSWREWVLIELAARHPSEGVDRMRRGLA